MAFRSISTNTTQATSIAVTPPAGIVNGDILVAFCVADTSSTQTITWPSGFTDITGSPLLIAGPDGDQLSVATKKASSESGNYTITNTTGGSSIIGGVAAFSGEDATLFLHRTSVNHSTASNASPQSITSSAFASNTTGVCDLIVIASPDVTSSASVTWTQPTGFTTRAAISDGGGASFRQVALFSKDAAASGETGAYTAVSTDGVTAGWCVFAIALLNGGSSPDATVTPTGFSLGSTLGTAPAGISVLPAGQSITSALGTATAGSQSSVTVTPTGLALAGSLGTFGTEADITMAPAGGSLSLALGTITTTGAGGNVNFVPVGYSVSVSQGTPLAVGDVVVPIGGFGLASSLGSPAVVFPALSVLPNGLLIQALLNTVRITGPASSGTHVIRGSTGRSHRSSITPPNSQDVS